MWPVDEGLAELAKSVFSPLVLPINRAIGSCDSKWPSYQGLYSGPINLSREFSSVPSLIFWFWFFVLFYSDVYCSLCDSALPDGQFQDKCIIKGSFSSLFAIIESNEVKMEQYLLMKNKSKWKWFLLIIPALMIIGIIQKALGIWRDIYEENRKEAE